MENDEDGGFVGIGGRVLWSISNMANPDEDGGGLGVILAASISNLENIGGGVGGRGRGVTWWPPLKASWTATPKAEGRTRSRFFSSWMSVNGAFIFCLLFGGSSDPGVDISIRVMLQ